MQDEFLDILSIHQGLIHKVCRLYRDDPEDRRDLFQEIVYQLLRAYPKFKGEGKISSWIYRVSLNTAMATFRKPRIRMEGEEKIPENVQEETESGQMREALMFEAIGMLDDAEKGCIALYLEGMSYSEIADVMGITENHLGVKLNRIKKKIREIIHHKSINI